MLGAGLPAARAYSPGGNVTTPPDNAFETVPNGYNPDLYLYPFDNLDTGPRNVGEAYRINTPVIYYTYDASFYGYFGTNGEAAIDQAFLILNNTFTYTNSIATNSIGVDGYSAQVQEFPDISQHINTTALGLELTDLKSEALAMMMPQLGLVEPDHYVWTLRNVNPTGGSPGGKCPDDAVFEVIQRNFGIVPGNTIPPYSSYINDELYSYEIQIATNCTPVAGGAPWVFLAVPFPAQTPFPSGLPQTGTAVASGELALGGFYTGLTRDDAAGLRYLLTTNIVNFETPAPGALLLATNPAPIVILTSSNLYTLLETAQTTDPALLPGLFPGLIVASSTNYYTTVLVTNYVSYINYNYGSDYGFGTLVTEPVVTPTFEEQYVTTFANVITNGNLINNPNIVLANTNIVLQFSTNTVVTTQTTSLGLSGYGSNYGTGATATNVQNQTSKVNVPSGEYLILPPGACGFEILAEITNQPVYTTNVITTATNANGFVDTVAQVVSFTPHQFLVEPLDCTTVAAAPGSYQGIGKVRFVRADFDPWTSENFNPVTNNYSMVLLNTNAQWLNQSFQRIVTAPDLIISAADITPNYPYFNSTEENTPNFVQDVAPQYGGLAGPGTITPPITFTFNKVGDLFLNGSYTLLGLTTNSFLNQPLQSQFGVIWASFDATTNPPFVYGTSLQNLESQLTIQITPPPPFLPNGSTTNNLSVTFSTSGGPFAMPYTWSAPGGLPPGLTLISNADSTGTLFGTPTQTGTFDITIQLTDNNGRTVSWAYVIAIN